MLFSAFTATVVASLLQRFCLFNRGPIRFPCRNNDIESRVCPTNSPRPGQAHLEFPINTSLEAASSSPPTHTESHSKHRTPLFITPSSSPSMTIVTEAPLPMPFPASLRPRTEVSRNTLVSFPFARRTLHHIPDGLLVQWLGFSTCRPLACRG